MIVVSDSKSISLELNFLLDSMRFMEQVLWNGYNCSRQMEGRSDTEKRARSFVDLLCKEGVDSAVVAHGFYMHVLLKEMRKAGFRIDKFHANYKNTECVIAER